MAVYLDASAAAKILLIEPESASLARWLTDHPQRVSSGLLRTELMRAIGRRVPERVVRARRMMRHMTLLAIDDDLLTTAGLLEPVALRSLDAIHLATALRLGDELDAIVTYDRRMIEGARAIGLPVASPGG